MIKYPIYIISKGRFEHPLTANTLESMNIAYKICVEPQEYSDYLQTIKKSRIIKLPENFSKKKQGGIPVRNWVFKDAIRNNSKRHWIIDDNISSFLRVNKNTKFTVKNDSTFRACEDFTDRFKNIAMSGMQYDCFVIAVNHYPPYNHNSRVYSCILLNNEIPFRWRGKYNEDTDLSLRCLKSGWNTILFNAFICAKATTLNCKGGNTDTIYAISDKRFGFARSLQRQHPDVTKIVWRYGRWHHQVDYSSFKERKLELKDDYIVNNRKVNNYGMKLYNGDKKIIQ